MSAICGFEVSAHHLLTAFTLSFQITLAALVAMRVPASVPELNIILFLIGHPMSLLHHRRLDNCN